MIALPQIKRLAFLVLLFSLGAAQERSSITGVITDADTGEKLPYVNVFLANTTIGDATDSAGVYLLERVPTGAYELVISHIGHELKVIPIQLEQAHMIIDVALPIKPLEGAEIQVEAQTPNEWLKMLDEFIIYFIGTSSRAKKCTILNPEVLNFRRHPESNCLLASTDSTLRIYNESLGYTIHLLLEHFHWYGDSGNYVIYPQFFDSFHNERHKRQCYKKRNELFERSLRRFLAYLAILDIPRSYSVKIYTTKPQPGFRELDTYDLRLLLKKSVTEGALRRFSSFKIIRVDYELENSPSFIKLNYGYIDINDKGVYAPMDGITLSGYWATFRLADTLPLDYWVDE